MALAKKILLRLLVCLASVAGCLGMAEVCLRMKNSSMKNYDIEMWRYAQTLKVPSSNPILGHEHVPSASAVLQSVEIRTNEWGLRGGPVPPPSPRERRILFLGSSVTLGWGVPEDETTTGVLQKMFDADGKKVRVLNAGIGNYNADRYVERFLTRLKDLNPTDVVVHYFVRDAEVLEAGGGNWLLRNSQLAVILWTAVHRQLSGTGDKTLEEHYRRVYQPDAPGFLAMQQALRRLKSYADEHNIRLYLALTPDVHNLQDYKLGFIEEAVHTFAAETGYRYLDLFPAFADLRAEEVWAMPGDPHPNRVGHERMAKLLYPFLTAEDRAPVAAGGVLRPAR